MLHDGCQELVKPATPVRFLREKMTLKKMTLDNETNLEHDLVQFRVVCPGFSRKLSLPHEVTLP
jgi:hypothetical protein